MGLPKSTIGFSCEWPVSWLSNSNGGAEIQTQKTDYNRKVKIGSDVKVTTTLLGTAWRGNGPSPQWRWKAQAVSRPVEDRLHKEFLDKMELTKGKCKMGRVLKSCTRMQLQLVVWIRSC